MRQKQINHNWKEFGLGEIAVVKKGTSITRKIITEGGIPVIAGGQKPAYYHNVSNRKGKTITISGSGAYAGFVAYFQKPIFASDCSTVQVDDKNILTRYVYLYLKGNQNKIYNLQKGIAQPHVYPKDIQKIKISLPILPNGTPDLEKQKQIVAILEKAEGLKDKHKGLDELFDEYLKSVFCEMFFGKDFEKGTIRELLEEAKYGSSKKANEEGRGYEMIRMNNITYLGGWNFDQLKYIELENDEEDKYLIRKGDILFNRTNSKELVGKTAVYRLNKPRAYAGYLVRLRTNKRADSEYISGFLNSEYGKMVLLGMCKSIVGMANINAQEVQNIKIPIPPIKLQEKFALIVEQVEKIKDKLKDGKKDNDELFNVLMQKAFLGELI